MPPQTIGERAAELVKAAQKLEQMIDGRLEHPPSEHDAESRVAPNPEHLGDVVERCLERQPTLQAFQIQIAQKLLSQQVQELAALIGELAKR